jgi:GntR family transcriptional regulator
MDYPMPLNLTIKTGSPTPIYRQIVDQLYLAAATGTILPGDAVPSVRGLAEQLVINPNTVAKAYNELRREGVIESQPGRGMFLADRRDVLTKAERMRRIQPLLSALAEQAVMLGLDDDKLQKLLGDEMKKVGRRPASGD